MYYIGTIKIWGFRINLIVNSLVSRNWLLGNWIIKKFPLSRARLRCYILFIIYACKLCSLVNNFILNVFNESLSTKANAGLAIKKGPLEKCWYRHYTLSYKIETLVYFTITLHQLMLKISFHMSNWCQFYQNLYFQKLWLILCLDIINYKTVFKFIPSK